MVKLNPYLKIMRSSAIMAVVMILFLGFIIPSITAEISEHIDPGSAMGSPVEINGKVYGSYLLAEAFNNSSLFFQARPSVTSYNLSESGSCTGSGDSSQSLNFTLKALKEFESKNPGVNLSSIPFAMIAYSASGLDPNIPVEGAYIQIPRIASNLSILFNGSLSISVLESDLMQYINSSEQQNFPIFGSYYTNTMVLNVDIINLMIKNGVVPKSLLD